MDFSKIKRNDLRKFMMDKKIGVDCSGLAYHILNKESAERGLEGLSKKIKFVRAKSLTRKIVARLRPARNIDVQTLSDDENSKEIPLSAIRPGDFIAILSKNKEKEFNHILVVVSALYERGIAKKFTYIHSIEWKEEKDENGVRFGQVYVTSATNSLESQDWVEKERHGDKNPTLLKVKSAESVSLRRLNWF